MTRHDNLEVPSRNPFERLEIDDPRRPIVVTGSVPAGVPAESRRFLDHHVDKVVFPSGKRGYHHRIKLPEGVMVAHLDEQSKIALVQNYRHPIGRDSIEIPSGALEPEELVVYQAVNPSEKENVLREAATREFAEEYGVSVHPDEVERVFPGPLQGSVGYADQTYHIFGAEGGSPVQQTLDDEEKGTLTALPRYSLDDAVEMIGHEIVDPATSATIARLALTYGLRLPRRTLRHK